MFLFGDFHFSSVTLAVCFTRLREWWPFFGLWRLVKLGRFGLRPIHGPKKKQKIPLNSAVTFLIFWGWIRNIFLSHSLWHHRAQRKLRLHNWWFQVSTQGGFQQLQDIYSFSFMQDHRLKNYVLFQAWNHHPQKKIRMFFAKPSKIPPKRLRRRARNGLFCWHLWLMCRWICLTS